LANPELQEKFAKRYKLPISDVRYIAKTHVSFADSRNEIVDLLHKSLKRIATKVPAQERLRYLTAVSSWIAATGGRAELSKTEQELAVKIINTHLEKILFDPSERWLYMRLVEKHGNVMAL
jgi:hypothetical protein